LLRQRGLNAKGRKYDLIQRLREDDADLEGQTILSADQAADDDNDVLLNAEAGNVLTDCADGACVRQESETIRILQLQIELEKIKLQQSQAGMNTVNGSSLFSGDRSDMAGIFKARLPVTSPDCDVIAYFMMPEKTLQLNAVPRELWARFLPSILNEKADKIFAQQSIECCRDYDVSRALLINAFKCNSDVYLRKLQTSTRVGNKSYTTFLNRLVEYQSFYLQSRHSVDIDTLKDDVVMNYFMLSLRDDVVAFVKGRQPKNAGEAAVAADLYYSVKSKGRVQRQAAHQTQAKNQWVKQQGCRFVKPQESKIPEDGVAANATSASKIPLKTENNKPKACWSCGSLSHIRAECPASTKPTATSGKRNSSAENSTFVTSNLRHKSHEKFVVPYYVKGHEAPVTAYRDSGASVSLACKDIVADSAYTGDTTTVRGVSTNKRLENR
jgi:hypothetical protein